MLLFGRSALRSRGTGAELPTKTRSIMGKLTMNSSTIDPRRLLGFRVLLAGADAGNRDIDAKDSRLGAKVGDIKPQVD